LIRGFWYKDRKKRRGCAAPVGRRPSGPGGSKKAHPVRIWGGSAPPYRPLLNSKGDKRRRWEFGPSWGVPQNVSNRPPRGGTPPKWPKWGSGGPPGPRDPPGGPGGTPRGTPPGVRGDPPGGSPGGPGGVPPGVPLGPERVVLAVGRAATRPIRTISPGAILVSSARRGGTMPSPPWPGRRGGPDRLSRSGWIFGICTRTQPLLGTPNVGMWRPHDLPKWGSLDLGRSS